MFRALGMASISARDKTSGCATFSTSTVASKASTVTVSPTEPTFISASTGTDTFAGTVTCCLTVLNPSRLKVITYRPGRTSTIVYRPDSLVVTMRDPSISASLAASTFTLGMTAPLLSFTIPEIVLCAQALGENSARITRQAKTCIAYFILLMVYPP